MGSITPKPEKSAVTLKNSPVKHTGTILCRFAFGGFLALTGTWLGAQPVLKLTSPREALGFNLGEDYQLANYTQLEAWWKKLATESDRMKLVDMGPTAEGRHQYMAIISSPENLKNLEHYRQISKRLALAEGLTDEEAHKLASEPGPHDSRRFARW